MKKKLFFLFSLSLVAMSVIFWHSLFGNFLAYTVNQYTLNKFGVPLKSNEVIKEGDYWVFKSLSIKRQDVCLTAENLRIKFDWSLFQSYVDISMKVEGSEIVVEGKTADLSSLFSDLLPKSLPFWMMSFHSACEVDNGRASWVVDRGKRESAVYYLSVKGNDERQELELSVWLNEDVKEKNAFRLQIEKKIGEGISTSLTFEQVECAKIVRGFEAAGHSLRGWEIFSGMIDGDVEVTWPKFHAPYATGRANLLDFVFGHADKKITGKVENVALDLRMEHVKGQAPFLEGKLEFLKGISLAFYRQEKPFWKIDQFSGGIYFRPERTLIIDMEGECSHEQRNFHLALDGDAQLIGKQQAALTLAARLFSEDGKEMTAQFIAEQLGPKEHQAELSFENVGPDEFAFVQEVLARYAADWKAFHVRQGVMNAAGVASMIGWNLTDLNIQHLEVKSLKFDVAPWDLSASVGDVSGDFSINLLVENPLKTIDAGFHISDGQLISRTLSGTLCCLSDVKTELIVSKGVVQQSEMQGEFAGFKGIVDIDWMARDKIAKLNFSGPSERLAPFLPVHFRSNFIHLPYSDGLEVKASVGFENGRFGIEGEVRLAEQEIAFGFQLEKSSEKLWKSWPADDLAASYWENAGLEVMQTVLPPIASPAVLYEANWIRSETGIAGLVLRNGWFKADDVDLEQFVSPFLFPNRQMNLFGKGNFKGGFDQNILTVEYDAENLVMENSFLAIKADCIGCGNQMAAAHYFNFKKGIHYGSISLNKAVYIEKNTGLVFSPTEAHVSLEGKKVHLTQIETECMGIQMAGDIDLDFGEPDDEIFDLEIRVSHVKGELENVQKLMARFNPDLWLLQLPVGGRLALREEGAFFRFSFAPRDFSLEAILKGSIRDGSLSMDQEGRSGLRGLQMNFGYNHRDHLFEITELQAEIQWDKISTGYHVFGDHMRFDDLDNGKSSFDLWIGDQTRDLVRFVGKTQKEWSEDDGSYIAVQINHHLTHAGNIHPSSFVMRLNDWTQIDTIQVGMSIELESFLSDLRSISYSGLGVVLGKFGNEIQSIQNATGVLDTQFAYDQTSQKLTFQLKGDQIGVNQLKAEKVQFLGEKINDRWIIEHFQWDDKSASGEFSPEQERWKVDRLQFKNSDIASVSLNGHLYLDRKKVDGRIEEMRIDMAQMSGSPEIEFFTRENDPHGTLSGSGNLNFEWGLENTPWKMEAILDVGLSDWDAKGMHFDDARNISCHFISDQGVTMRKLQTKVLDSKLGAVLANIEVEKMQYDFSSGEIVFDDLKFEAPAHRLSHFSAQLEESFPYFFTPGMGEVIRDCKLAGILKGKMQYELTPPYTAVRLELDDGEYCFLNTSHQLTQFVMNYDPFEFTVTSGYRLAGKNVWLYARSSSPSLAYGELILTDQPPKQIYALSQKEALYFDWENHQETGISFSRIEGCYQGLSMQLEKDPTQPPSKESLCLVGTVDIHGQKAKGFFPEQMAEKIVSWRVGDGYQLKGKWRFLKNHSESYVDKLHFVGMLKGNHFRLKGYQFDILQAHLECTPTAIRINDLLVKDPCGVLSSDRIDIIRTDLGTWAFAMPLMSVNKFRPCLLQEEGMPRPTVRKPMVIQELVLEKTQGNFSDSRTVIGRGSFYFTNRSKKLLQNTIFQLPSDILSRIGLDPAVLTPVTGTVQYVIRDGKIYLTKFKDIYSDAKLSKFYLASSSQSTMDFDGSLNVQIKMKQYNLIFKLLAEPFTFNIQGDLKKPLYSIQKHHGDSLGSY